MKKLILSGLVFSALVIADETSVIFSSEFPPPKPKFTNNRVFEGWVKGAPENPVQTRKIKIELEGPHCEGIKFYKQLTYYPLGDETFPSSAIYNENLEWIIAQGSLAYIRFGIIDPRPYDPSKLCRLSVKAFSH